MSVPPAGLALADEGGGRGGRGHGEGYDNDHAPGGPGHDNPSDSHDDRHPDRGAGETDDRPRGPGPQGMGRPPQGGLPPKQFQFGQNDALHARNRGEIISLKEALDAAQTENPGKVIEVKLFQNGDAATYRIKTIDGEGVVKSTKLDARTGQVSGILDIVKRSLGLDENSGGGR